MRRTGDARSTALEKCQMLNADADGTRSERPRPKRVTQPAFLRPDLEGQKGAMGAR